MKIDLSVSQVSDLRQAGWEVGPAALSKTFLVKGYKNVMLLSNDIFNIAENHNHHPDMLIKYGSVKVSIFNHDKKSISKLCYDFAIDVQAAFEKINQ